MASLFKQVVTRPMPVGAAIFTRNGQRLARWMVRGKVRTAKVTGEGGALRIQTESSTWYARIRLADGCRDKSAAASRMAELVAEQEKIRGGILTVNETRMSKQKNVALASVKYQMRSSSQMRARRPASEAGIRWMISRRTVMVCSLSLR